MNLQQINIDHIADTIINAIGPEAALQLVGGTYEQYRDDPVGFGEKVLGETYTDDIKRMMESVRDYEITIAVSANGTGKTHAAGRVAAWYYLTRKNVEVYTAAAPPEDNLYRLLWGEIRSVMEKHPGLFTGSKITSMHIERTAKEFITGVTIPISGDAKTREARFSGKHQQNLMFIFDEGDAIPDEVYAGRESCTSGGEFRTLVMFNPRQPKGEAYRMIRDGRAHVVELSAFRHPNVITGENIIPGAVDRNTTVRRISQMCRPIQPDESTEGFSTFHLPDFLVGAKAIDQKGQELSPLQAGTYKVMVPAFSHMVLGQYPAQAEDQLISQEWINSARMRWDLYVARYGEKIPDGVQGVAGLDPGEFGADPTVLIEKYGGWVPMPTQWSGVDIIITSETARKHLAGKPIRCTNVDATGVGSGVAPDMMRHNYTAQAIKVAETKFKEESYYDQATSEIGEFKIFRDCLAWMLREWLRCDAGAMLPPDEELLEELRIPTYAIEGKYIRVMPKDLMKEQLKRSSNKFDALSLCFAKPIESATIQTMSQSSHEQLKAKYSRFGRGMRMIG